MKCTARRKTKPGKVNGKICNVRYRMHALFDTRSRSLTVTEKKYYQLSRIGFIQLTTSIFYIYIRIGFFGSMHKGSGIDPSSSITQRGL